jgi:hypothetical protein
VTEHAAERATAESFQNGERTNAGRDVFNALWRSLDRDDLGYLI